MERTFIGEISQNHFGKPFVEVIAKDFDHPTWASTLLESEWGIIMQCDLYRRIYFEDGYFIMESREQASARLGAYKFD